MKSVFSRLLPLLSCSLALLAFGTCISEETSSYVRVGDKLPAFSVTMNDGQIISNDSLKGSFSLVMFFHTTCSDCQQTLPYIQQAYESFPEVRFVLISRAETDDSLSAYWQHHQLTVPYSAQSDRQIYELFATSVVPRIYLCDPGTVVKKAYDDQVAVHAETILDDLRQLTVQGR